MSLPYIMYLKREIFFNASWLFIVTPNLFYILLRSSLISIFGLTFAHALKNNTLGIFFKLFSPIGFVLFSFPLRMYNITPNLKKRVNDNSEVDSEIIYNNTYTIYSKSLYLNSIALSFWPKSQDRNDKQSGSISYCFLFKPIQSLLDIENRFFLNMNKLLSPFRILQHRLAQIRSNKFKSNSRRSMRGLLRDTFKILHSC